MMEVMAAASTAVKLGSVVMAAVTVSASDGCCWFCCKGGLGACSANWEDPTS